jgi:hypothetical protein
MSERCIVIHLDQRGAGIIMRKTYFTVVYVVLSLAALVLASGAPGAFSGTGNIG